MKPTNVPRLSVPQQQLSPTPQGTTSPTHNGQMLPAPSEVELAQAHEIIKKAAGLTGREDSLSVIDQMVEEVNTSRAKHGTDAMMALSNSAHRKYNHGNQSARRK